MKRIRIFLDRHPKMYIAMLSVILVLIIAHFAAMS